MIVLIRNIHNVYVRPISTVAIAAAGDITITGDY